MKKIVLTGGGTAGHVTPNIALIPKLIKDGSEISSASPAEKDGGVGFGSRLANAAKEAQRLGTMRQPGRGA